MKSLAQLDLEIAIEVIVSQHESLCLDNGYDRVRLIDALSSGLAHFLPKRIGKRK